MNEPLVTFRARAYALVTLVMLGILSLQLTHAPSYACPIFPAAGLALVLMLMSGNRQWPSVWVGALIVCGYATYRHGSVDWGDAPVLLATACGVVLQAWAGAWLIRRWLPQHWQHLEGQSEVLTFLALGGPLACVISATVGVMSLYAAGKALGADVPWVWLTWWCGDLLGVLMFAPLTMAFFKRQEPLWRGRLGMLGGLVLVSVSAVLAVFIQLSKMDQARYREEISIHAEVIKHHIEIRLESYKEMLEMIVHMIEVSPNLSREQFEYFTYQAIKDDPDQRVLGFKTYVPNAGYAALGLDGSSDPTHAAAIADAIERTLRFGKPTLTGPIVLMRDPKEDALVLYPAYQRNTKKSDLDKPPIPLGFIVSTLKVAEMAKIAQTAVGPSFDPGVVFTLNDPKASLGQHLLFQSDPSPLPSRVHLVWHDSISVFDRNWDIVVYPNQQWLGEHRAWTAWVVGAAGLLLTSVLQVLILVSTGRTALVRRQVQEQTIELRETTDALHERSRLIRNVIDNIADPVFLKDEQGTFVLVNAALARLYNTHPAALIGLRPSDLSTSVSLASGFVRGEQSALSNGETLVFFEDIQDSATGKVRHYKSTKTPMTDLQGRPQVLVVVQDMTEIMRSYQQVAQSEQRLQDVMNITHEAMWDWHIPTGRVLHNQQWCVTLGLQPSQVSDTEDTFYAWIHPDDKSDVMKRLDALLRGETGSYQSEHRMLGQQGMIWVQDRGGVVERDEQGCPVRVVGSFTDITERRNAQDRITDLLSEQRAILQSDVVGLLITQGSRMLWVTPSLLRTLGYDWLHVEGLDIRFMFQNEEAFLSWGEAAYPVIRAYQVFRTSLQFCHKNGTLIWFDLAGTMFGKNSDQVLWSCVDITAQKSAEAKLIEAQQEALAATAAKSQFLATMSHEVRTPMNGILGMAQLLVKPEIQDEKRIQYAKTILNAGQTLLSLLNDILDLSKVEAGKLNLESIAFAVDPIVSDIQALFAKPAHAKGLQLTSDWQGPAGTCYLGDPYRLRQMLSNLVNNAIKFTASGFVHIVANEIERQSRHAVLEFSVSDSGVGITLEQQARLFQPFSQADTSTTRRFGGTGLGLSIVLRLAHLMGGEVGIDSQPGQGARFWFRIRVDLQLDALMSPETTEASEDVPAVSLAGKLLIAEDNPVNRMVITAMLDDLSCSGVTVTIVEDGQQALDHITQGGAPNLVLMDVQMPVMDGLTATELIRSWQADHGKPRLPIVALTASAYQEDRQKCLDSGMDDVLVKPLDIQKLQATLTRWL